MALVRVQGWRRSRVGFGQRGPESNHRIDDQELARQYPVQSSKSRFDRRADGAGYRLLWRAYMFWAILILSLRVFGGCPSELVCRAGASARLSTLVLTVPLSVILATKLRRKDDTPRLLLMALMVAAVLMAPDMIGNAIARLVARIA